MTSQSTDAHNAAAWSLREKSRPVVVAAAPYTRPAKGHVVVKVHCVAINPIDWIVQDSDVFSLRYPTVLGLDIAGEIYEVGEGVHSFSKGQKVIALGNGYSSKTASHGAFQRFCNIPATAVAQLPASITLEQGVVLPLSITTAAAGLYQPGYLALPFPRAQPEPLGRSVLVWGGSSSVGSSVIQLAVASGATVIAVASATNFQYCKALGAHLCFDYHSSSVEDDIVAALQDDRDTVVAGAYHAAGDETAVISCARIVDRLAHSKTIVVTVRAVPASGIPSTVRIKAIASTAIFEQGNAIGPYIWQEYLPAALERRSIVPKPDPLVVGEGLRSVQHGLDVQRRGVSAAKVVVTDICNE